MSALVAQAAKPAEKVQVKAETPAATAAKLKDARRLLQNGRYAEAEEALTVIETEAKKEPGGFAPSLKSALALGKAECQSSQGEYVKAIDALKAVAAEEPKNADLAARLADLQLTRGELGSRRGRGRPGRETGSQPLAGSLGPGSVAGASRRARQGGRRLEMVHRSLQRKTARDCQERRRVAFGRPGLPSVTIEPAPAARN